MTLDQDKFIPVKEYANSINVHPDTVIQDIRNGVHIGQLINNEWHVYIPDEDTDGAPTRLGHVKHLKGIDPEYLPLFAKIARVIGLLIIISFVLWGLTYSWSYRYTPFEALMRYLGVRSSNTGFGVTIFSAVVLFFGWYYRFGIGTVFATIIFKFYDIIKLFIKKI